MDITCPASSIIFTGPWRYFIAALLFLVIILPIALLLTYLHLKSAEKKLRKKFKKRTGSTQKLKKIFQVIESRNRHFEQEKQKERERIVQELDLPREASGSPDGDDPV